MIEQTQGAFSVAITKEALDFQASMSAALINGSIQKGAEMETLLRGQGLAAEGIGQNINIAV